MSNNRLVFEGLSELRAALRQLPTELAGEASGIVIGAAESAASLIVGSYPSRTAELRKGVKVTTESIGPYGAGAKVRNSGKLSSIFENGTQARHTAIGANRGSMPPGHVFVPIVIRERRKMYVKLRELLVRHGLSVSGEP